MKKNDFILILAVIVAAAVFLLLRQYGSAGLVQITVDGRHYSTLSLNEDSEISINGTNILKIRNGEAYMSYASCPDKLCIHQGKISDGSKAIVCLPNKVVIKVKKEGAVDAVVK